MAKKKKGKRCWEGSNMSSWTLSQIPISLNRVKERKEKPHQYLNDMEYVLEVKAPMCERIILSMTDMELVDLITNAELLLKRRSLPQ